MAFLGIGKKKQKKAAASSQAMIDKLLASGQSLSERNQQLAILASDGKISTKEKKLIKQAARLGEKTNRVEVRAVKSTTNTAARADARKTAYANGIDPRKWVSDALGEVSKGVVGVAAAGAAGRIGSAIAGRTNSGGNNSVDSMDYESIMERLREDGSTVPPGRTEEDGFVMPAAGMDKKTMLLIGAGIVALFLFSKKR